MWIYQNKEFTQDDIPDTAYGFVYLMTATIDGKHVGYIGKKSFYLNTKQNIGIKEKAALKAANPHSKKTKKIVTKLAYQNYFSSNKTLLDAQKAGIPIKRMILEICNSNRELSYKEVKYQFKCDVLESDVYLNDNILGKFYKYGINSISRK
jgi:hypothetical protein